MDDCVCGARRKQYWLWRDLNGGVHASHFSPSSGLIRSVMAVTARDALLPAANEPPRHWVHDVDDSTVQWNGLCAAASAAV